MLPYSRMATAPGNSVILEPTEIFRVPREHLAALPINCPTVTAVAGARDGGPCQGLQGQRLSGGEDGLARQAGGRPGARAEQPGLGGRPERQASRRRVGRVRGGVPRAGRGRSRRPGAHGGRAGALRLHQRPDHGRVLPARALGPGGGAHRLAAGPRAGRRARRAAGRDQRDPRAARRAGGRARGRPARGGPPLGGLRVHGPGADSGHRAGRLAGARAGERGEGLHLHGSRALGRAGGRRERDRRHAGGDGGQGPGEVGRAVAGPAGGPPPGAAASAAS